EGNLETIDLPNNITIITYVQVLEHIVDINTELQRVARAIPDGGLLFIEVPGLTSVPRKYHFDVLRLLQLAHIWHFTPDTLQTLLAKHGFECLAIDDTIRGLFRYNPDG